MLLNNVTAFAAAALLGFAKLANTYWLLILGRFVIGINCGINSALAPLYLTEIAPVNLRGMLGTVNQLLVTISIMIAIILGLKYEKQKEKIDLSSFYGYFEVFFFFK